MTREVRESAGPVLGTLARTGALARTGRRRGARRVPRNSLVRINGRAVVTTRLVARGTEAVRVGGGRARLPPPGGRRGRVAHRGNRAPTRSEIELAGVPKKGDLAGDRGDEGGDGRGTEAEAEKNAFSNRPCGGAVSDWPSQRAMLAVQTTCRDAQALTMPGMPQQSKPETARTCLTTDSCLRNAARCSLCSCLKDRCTTTKCEGPPLWAGSRPNLAKFSRD